MSDHADIGRRRQAEIYIAGFAGRQPRVPTSPDALERRAAAAMTAEARAYVVGGAGAERTMQANRAAFGRHPLVPRVLHDVGARDLSCELFGRTLPAPMLLAPIGVLDMVHREGDLAVARAAAATGIPMIFSNQASVPMEDCARAMGQSPRWFQLYWSRSDALVQSFVARAESCGCDAIVLTLDTTMLGWRPQDLDLGSLPFLEGRGIAQYTSDPVFRASLATPLEGATAPKARVTTKAIRGLLRMGRRFPGSTTSAIRSGEARRAVQRFIATYSRPTLEWRDLSRLRAMTTLPIVLKGILHPDDARMAIDEGMSGIVVSNHGGRQVDNAVATIDALPAVVSAVDGRIPVLFDSGIRSGADVLVAIALGASAVLLGRPFVYGLAIDGERGVRAVIENVLAELDLTMGLCGCRSLAEARALFG